MTLSQWWSDLKGEGLGQGVHRFDGKGEWQHHRFHLRVDPENKGVLLVDASNMLFLNGTAIDYVRCALEGRDEASMSRYMMRRYRNLDEARAKEDYLSTKRKLDGFVKGDLDVLGHMGSDRPTYGLDDLPAPYRMDLALTYRCQNRCLHCYNEPKRKEELTPDQWKAVIGKLWNLGIPHIVFTGGEPTLYPGLDELISVSERYGQITGLVTNGRRLRDRQYLRGLVQKGLDHIQITVLSYKETVHDGLVDDKGAWKQTVEGLKAALAEDVYVSTNTTIMRSNCDHVEDTLRFLAGLGVRNVAFNGIIRSGKGKDAEGLECSELEPVLLRLKQLTGELGLRLTWFTPTPYCELNPVNLGLGIKQCTACALNMAIEPDGEVLPCQSYYRSLGNIIHDDWKDIWGNQLCKDIRERRYLDGKCSDCELKDLCGGGCPLAREHGDYLCLDARSSV
ncbi:MAG: radical SAM protein [Methanomassiliicoccales archaeon]|nr:radical SAM protein [Methanomassiliicoccales archaeon]